MDFHEKIAVRKDINLNTYWSLLATKWVQHSRYPLLAWVNVLSPITLVRGTSLYLSRRQCKFSWVEYTVRYGVNQRCSPNHNFGKSYPNHLAFISNLGPRRVKSFVNDFKIFRKSLRKDYNLSWLDEDVIPNPALELAPLKKRGNFQWGQLQSRVRNHIGNVYL